MSKRSQRIGPFFVDEPTSILRSARSFMSRTRPQVMFSGSSSGELPKYMWLSASALSRLCALVTAWRSPVKCMLIWSAGTTFD